MFGYSPTVVDDELIYSALAKHAALVGMPRTQTYLDSLYEVKNALIHPLLPTRLITLSEQAVLRHRTASELMLENTLYPYYSRFLRDGERENLVDGLLNGWPPNGRGGFYKLGFPGLHSTTLRFCPSCVESDQATVGMSAWRRVHQLPQVCVCPVHGCWLRNSNVSSRIQSELTPCPSIPGDGADVQSVFTLSGATGVAMNSLWLLRNPGPSVDPGRVWTRVVAMLAEVGLVASSSLKTDWQAELSRIWTGAGVFQSGNGSGLGRRCTAWLARFLADPLQGVHRPLDYLVLLAVLKRDISELLGCGADGISAGTDKPRLSISPTRPSRAERVAEYRVQALEIISGNPASSRSQLRGRGECMDYLLTHDAAWLASRLPPPRTKMTGLDWEQLDQRLLSLFQAAAARLMADPDHPARPTFQDVVLAVAGRGSGLERQQHRLPRSAAAVDGV